VGMNVPTYATPLNATNSSSFSLHEMFPVRSL